MNFKKEVSKSFNKSSSKYEVLAEVQNAIGRRLIARLAYLKIAPKYILDLGCGPGNFTKELKELYPKAHVVGLDLAINMLDVAKSKQTWRKKWSLVNADMQLLPFENAQFDLIFSNQVIHWGESIPLVLKELNRVLAINGCLMFTTLGPDTFIELKESFKSVDNFAHVIDFLDMHDIGDILLAEHYENPVIDMEKLTIKYAKLASLLLSLQGQGVKNINPKRRSTLTGKNRWINFENEMLKFKTNDDKYPLTYEVIFGHAWKGNLKSLQNGSEAVISVDDLRATLKTKKL